jgi:hypothetical protein
MKVMAALTSPYSMMMFFNFILWLRRSPWKGYGMAPRQRLEIYSDISMKSELSNGVSSLCKDD